MVRVNVDTGWFDKTILFKQECIPVGCVPAAHRPSREGGVCASQQDFFWGKKIEKKKKKNLEEPPPENFRHPPPWTEILTHAYENITLAQLRCGR